MRMRNWYLRSLQPCWFLHLIRRFKLLQNILVFIVAKCYFYNKTNLNNQTMTTRRSFLKTSAVLSAGLLVAPKLFAYDKKHIGLQLYTVRDAMGKDAAGTLAKVAQIGYNSVEAGYADGKYYGLDPQAFAGLLKQNNLIMPSTH